MGRSGRRCHHFGKNRCVMSLASVIEPKDGRALGVYHRPLKGRGSPLQVAQAISGDGGFTWPEPRVVAEVEGKPD